MPTFRRAVVRDVVRERAGYQHLAVDCDGQAAAAYVLTELTGPCAVGDHVIVNTTAVELGLGTGGAHVVHWNLSRDEWVNPGPGHIMKVRYTSVQVDSGSIEEHRGDVPARLDAMPVVVCSLHSQVAIVAAAIRLQAPQCRIAYVMTDGAALPAALSELLAALRRHGFIDVSITAGHAFGGDHEAVNVASALCHARHSLDADVAIVAMGPGVVGTATSLGTSAIEVANVIDNAAALGGRPIVCVRSSSADGRDRHNGLSHHVLTALRLARTSAAVAVSRADAAVFSPLVAGTADEGRAHVAVDVDAPDVDPVLSALGIHVRSMGRRLAQDPMFHRNSAAAGTLAATLINNPDGPNGPFA